MTSTLPKNCCLIVVITMLVFVLFKKTVVGDFMPDIGFRLDELYIYIYIIFAICKSDNFNLYLFLQNL